MGEVSDEEIACCSAAKADLTACTTVAKNSGDGCEELDAEDTGRTLLPLAGFSEVETMGRGKASAPAAAWLLQIPLCSNFLNTYTSKNTTQNN